MLSVVIHSGYTELSGMQLADMQYLEINGFHGNGNSMVILLVAEMIACFLEIFVY